MTGRRDRRGVNARLRATMTALCLGGLLQAAEPADSLRWPQPASLPDREDSAYPDAGVHNGAFLVAGDVETPDATAALRAYRVRDLAAGQPQWRELEPRPDPGPMLATAAWQDGAFHLVGGTAPAADVPGKPARTCLRGAYRRQRGCGWRRVADLTRPAVDLPGIWSLLVDPRTLKRTP